MLFPRLSLFVRFAAIAALGLPCLAQSVVSTRAGVIHYFEGAVFMDGQRLESRLGTFPVLPENVELRTAGGRAELLIAPDVFLRLADQTVIRMASSDLADTRIELESGSAILVSVQQTADTCVTITYKDWSVQVKQAGSYRIDSEPARLSVTRGSAEVSSSAGNPPVTVGQGMNLPFATVLAADRVGDQPRDAFAEWSKGRDQSISSDNTILAQLDQDPGSAPAADGGFTYYPMIGLLPPVDPNLTSGLYGSLYPNQPGFSSIYLPGYTYMPVFVGLVGRAPLGRYPMGSITPARGRIPIYTLTPRPTIVSSPGLISSPRIGTAPRIGSPTSIGMPSSVGVRTPAPVIAPRPVAPAVPVRAPTPIGRPGGHR